MAVNLIDSDDIQVSQTGENIQLETSTSMSEINTKLGELEQSVTDLKGGEVYSTSEVKTNKKWHNNKPIYRKVFVLTSPTQTGTWTDYTHNIANIDEFTFYSANINLPTVGHQYFADFYESSTYYFNFIPKLTVFSARVGYSQYTNKNMTVVVEYTKTTD